jgi:hypothetical protein
MSFFKVDGTGMTTKARVNNVVSVKKYKPNPRKISLNDNLLMSAGIDESQYVQF